MLCLGIESSCDETALSLVEDGTVIGSVLSSQTDIHAFFGGVVPELASRRHYQIMGSLFSLLMERSGKNVCDIDAVAVARGPGLLGSLLVGMAFGKMTALLADASFIGINHLHAHLMAATIYAKADFPFLGVLISGGHTNLYRVNDCRDFQLLGQTIDDAVGESFDKVGTMLGLAYPAGSIIDSLGDNGDADAVHFPRPYLDNDELDFSFSGLKTAVATYLRNARNDLVDGMPEFLQNTCASFNKAVSDTICAKIELALRKHTDLKTLVLAGGAARNRMLRKDVKVLCKNHGKIFLPAPASLCTDNAVMIAYLGWLLAKNGWRHDLHAEAIPRGRPIPEDMTRVALSHG